MPYYSSINTLTINIPSCGMNIIDDKLKVIYRQSLVSRGKRNRILPPPDNLITLQHQFYSTLIKYNNLCRLRTDNLKSYAMIRNPYSRVIADLFFLRLIRTNSSKKYVYKVLQNKYLNRQDLDNHNTPQWKFVTDANGNLIPKIVILKYEDLTKSFETINCQLKKKILVRGICTQRTPSWLRYLNDESIKLINDSYQKDFDLFKYARTIPDTLQINKPISEPVNKSVLKQSDNPLIVGNVNDLPFNYELTRILQSIKKTVVEKRVILVNPSETVYKDVLLSNYQHRDIFVLITDKTDKTHLSSSQGLPVFVLQQTEIPNTASFVRTNGINTVTGKIGIVLLYEFIFNNEREIIKLNNFYINYKCQVKQPTTISRPQYKNGSEPLISHIDTSTNNTVSVDCSVLICACHFKSTSEVSSVVSRCKRLASALNHSRLIFVYSLNNVEHKGLKTVIKEFSSPQLTFIQDTKNRTLDAGKYLIGLKAIKAIKDIYSQGGVVTLFNDSVLLANDLDRFKIDYENVSRENDFIGCISSVESGYHFQSWFINFQKEGVIEEYINALSLIPINFKNIRKSVISHMEIGICSYLTSKYKARAIYNLHTLYQLNGVNAVDESAIYLRTSLERCGFPFVKKRLIRENTNANLFGVQVKDYS